MTELNIKTGDIITYSCAAGVLTAKVRSVRFAPTAKPGYSIPWLNITTAATKTSPFPSDLSIPADAASLKMFKVAVI